MRFNYSREDLKENGLGILMIKTLMIKMSMRLKMMDLMKMAVEKSIKMQETNKTIYDNLTIRTRTEET